MDFGFAGLPDTKRPNDASRNGQTILQVPRSGGTGKAEAAKLPGAGIGPKPCPGKCAAEKVYSPKSVEIRIRSRGGPRARLKTASHHPRTEVCLTWLRKRVALTSRTLLPRDAERFLHEVAHVEKFLEGRHPKEKALAIFAGPKTWTVFPLQIAVENYS
jgi:hypothetical protein